MQIDTLTNEELAKALNAWTRSGLIKIKKRTGFRIRRHLETNGRGIDFVRVIKEPPFMYYTILTEIEKRLRGR
jgi:hypothetical protein